MLMRGLAALLAGALHTSIGVIPGMRLLDRFAGLVLGLVAGVFLCWAIGAVLLYLPGETDLRRSVQRSAILSEINDVFPPERLLEELERVDPIGVFLGPPAIVAPPDKGLAKDPDVVRASTSVVRVTGVACGLGVEGSGWVAAPGLVVTNAHVVAGIARPRVDTPEARHSRPRSSRSTRRTTSRCSACPGSALARSSLEAPEREPPSRSSATRATGRSRGRAARLGGTADVLSRDAYGRGPITRQITTIRGAVEPGSSGGPGVDTQGHVRTTVFARRPRETGGYGIPADLVRKVLAQVGKPVARTSCTD